MKWVHVFFEFIAQTHSSQSPQAFGKEADHIQMTALGRVLQVDLKVCYLDASEKEHVDWHELGVSGDESGEGNVITLLYRPGHVDLMYK